MTKEECIALLNRYAEYDGMGIPNLAGCRDAMRTAAELLQQPSLPSNLDEAAEDSWAVYEYRESPRGLYYTCYVDGFKACAEWMAGQGCTVEIDEGYFINNPHHDRRKGKFHKYYSSTFGHSEKIVVTPGDKVVVQIRKK